MSNIMSALSQDQRETFEKLPAWKRLRFLKDMTKLYNTLCGSCQRDVRKDPDMALEFYCEDCQSKIKNILGRYI